jgi:hypothetical protein
MATGLRAMATLTPARAVDRAEPGGEVAVGGGLAVADVGETVEDAAPRVVDAPQVDWHAELPQPAYEVSVELAAQRGRARPGRSIDGRRPRDVADVAVAMRVRPRSEAARASGRTGVWTVADVVVIVGLQRALWKMTPSTSRSGSPAALTPRAHCTRW